MTAGDVERAISVARPARDEHIGGAALVARDEAGAPLEGGAEAGVGGVLVHNTGNGPSFERICLATCAKMRFPAYLSSVCSSVAFSEDGAASVHHIEAVQEGLSSLVLPGSPLPRCSGRHRRSW